MGIQKFRATESFTWPNGAIGWRPGGMMDCIGLYAKVQHCPVRGYPDLRVTAYATGYADTFFSVPAACKVRGRYVGGFFSHGDMCGDGVEFVPYNRFVDRLPARVVKTTVTDPVLARLYNVITGSWTG